MNGLLEIMTTKMWMMPADFIHSFRSMIEGNLNGHLALELDEKKMPCVALAPTEEGQTITIREYQVTENGEVTSRWWMDEMKSPFVNIMPIDGPITRNGGACSYGSAEIRDWMMEAAENELCMAHVFNINTPGGSAWAKNDFQQAIDYAHSKGQKVYAYIDGMCASAGMYLASMCDEVYYMHPKNQIGCIGVMAAFYTEKNGTYNQYTNETYREYYDPESSDKNKQFRDIAENDDATDLINELAELGKEFRADVKKAFPNAKDEHVKGKIFNAEDVKGILCDGNMSLGEVVGRAFAVANGTEEPITRVVFQDEEGEGGEKKNAPAQENEESLSKPQENMTKFEKIAAASGVEELIANEEGAHFVPAMLESLEQTLTKQEDEKAAAESLIAGLREDVTKAQNEKDEAVAQKEKELTETHEQAVKELNEKHEQEINQLNESHSTELQAEREAKENAEKELADMKAELETVNQTLKDRDAQIEQLLTKPADQPAGSPANNGQGAEQKEEGGMPAYDHTKSPLENAKIRKEYMEKISK